MSGRAGPSLAAALLALLLGCGGGGAPGAGGSGGGEPPAGTRVRLELRLPGDDIGAADDRADLDAIAEGIRGRAAGEVVGREFGMGRMAAVVVVQGPAPLAAIRAAVEQVRPGAPLRLEVVPPPEGARP